METRSLLRQVMGYSLPLGFLILLAVATNVDGDTNFTAVSPPHPSAAAEELSQNASTSEAIHKSGENENDKPSGEGHSVPLEPLSEESNAAAKRPPPNTTIRTTESSPSKKPRAKPERAAAGGLTASLGIIMAMILSLLLCF